MIQIVFCRDDAYADYHFNFHKTNERLMICIIVGNRCFETRQVVINFQQSDLEKLVPVSC